MWVYERNAQFRELFREFPEILREDSETRLSPNPASRLFFLMDYGEVLSVLVAEILPETTCGFQSSICLSLFVEGFR